MDTDVSARNTATSSHSHPFLPQPFCAQRRQASRGRGVSQLPDRIRGPPPAPKQRGGPRRIKPILGGVGDTRGGGGGRGTWATMSESEMGYWLGHILEEGVSQSCLCRNPLVGVIVQHLR